MMTRRTLLAGMASVGAVPAFAQDAGVMPNFSFVNVDGGTHETASWLGRPVLYVNTASRCGFTPQYDEMQVLHETYGPRGLIVLAIPSDDFNQELSSIAEVKDFCELNFGLTLPMTDITHVKGPEAHPMYVWLRENAGFEPGWNFNKVLVGADGRVRGTWGSLTKPDDETIVSLFLPELTS